MQQTTDKKHVELVLASTSPYRRALLAKLGLSFRCLAPDIDETPRAAETAPDLVCRLAREKALAVREKVGDDAWIIACDQVAAFEGDVLGKPGDFPHAQAQLRRFSGQCVVFYTALCVAHAGKETLRLEPFSVYFRDLSDEEIDVYLQIEQPFDCAGSFKSEGLGILLFERLAGRDPNALIGLPLMALNDLFQQHGLLLLRLAQQSV